MKPATSPVENPNEHSQASREVPDGDSVPSTGPTRKVQPPSLVNERCPIINNPTPLDFAPAAGDVVVLRGLTRNAADPSSGERVTPRIGLVVDVPPRGRGLYLVRLRMGIKKFARKGRVVRRDQIARLATPREITVGLVMSPAVSS